jgi:tetratricopeptide (TPR) repeat protein
LCTITLDALKTAETNEDKTTAEAFKNTAEQASKLQEWQRAVEFYTEAIKIDLRNSVYRSNRAAVLISMEQFYAAQEDAFIATKLDPTNAIA